MDNQKENESSRFQNIPGGGGDQNSHGINDRHIGEYKIKQLQISAG